MGPLTEKQLPLNPSNKFLRYIDFGDCFLFYPSDMLAWCWLLKLGGYSQCCGSGIRSKFFDPWIRDQDPNPGWKKSRSGIRDPGSGFLCQTYLHSLSTAEPDMESKIRCFLIQDPGSGAY